MEVLGIEFVDYVSKKSGNAVTGVRLHLAEDLVPGTSNGCGYGRATLAEFISRDKFNSVGDVTVGDNIRLIYNKYGRVSDIEIV